jgi:regulator of replication initiation timing
MFDNENNILEDLNNNENQIDNIYYTKMIEQYGQMINMLRNENFILKNNLDEKTQIIKNFQNVTHEAKKKIDKLIENNEELLIENNQLKEKLKQMNEKKKENEKNDQIKIEDELKSLKQELNTVHNYFSKQLKNKESCITSLQKNYHNLEGQYQITLKNTLNNCSNNNKSNNNNYTGNNSFNGDYRKINSDFNIKYNCSNIVPKSVKDLNNYNTSVNTNY